MQPPIFEKNLDIKQKMYYAFKKSGTNGSMPRDCRATVRTILYPWLFIFSLLIPPRSVLFILYKTPCSTPYPPHSPQNPHPLFPKD